MNTKKFPNDTYIRTQAKLADIEVEHHGSRYTFYTWGWRRTIGTYTHNEAVAFIDGFKEAQRAHKEEWA